VARNEVFVEAPPAEVFAVLTDPDSYGFWVVGSKTIRGHDRTWPRPGSRFHHTVGVGPVKLRDDTKVLDIEKDRRLVLEARVRPFGTAVVDIELQRKRRGKATKVTMHESGCRGALARVWNPLFDALTYARNAVALQRLKRLAEARAAA
jgi:uncharacterized protein YndB with AHSA1/START domain